MRGLRAGFAKGARSLDDLGRRLSKAVRFRGFKLTRSGRVITLWGKVNPDVPLADFVLPDSGLLREDVELLVAPKDNLGVTLRKRDWDDHILDHVEAHFDQAKRMRQGKDVTTVFLGTPAEYAALLERALKTKNVQLAVKTGIPSDIEFILDGQLMRIAIDMKTMRINTFHPTGRRIGNPRKFRAVQHPRPKKS